jgi:hypothetical protein
MSDLLEQIRTRGYWRVEIRPTRFIADRLPEITSLFPLVERLSVRFRGWDYPHIDQRNRPHIDQDWVGQDFAWAHYREIWRLYQSAKFLHLFGLSEDWRDASELWPAPPGWEAGQNLYAMSALQTYTEVYEFAARLSLAIPGDDPFYVGTRLANLRGRSLAGDQSTLFWADHYVAQISQFEWNRELERGEMVARSRDLAAEAAKELLARFGWEVSVAFLRNQQLVRP